MKFLCDRCKTRYSIGDDRVRGKILKIRCKNCNNVITVREGMPDADAVDPAAAGASPAAGASGAVRRPKQTTAAPSALGTSPAPGHGALGAAFATAMTKPPPALEEEWYVSIDGDQAGPFSLAEAQRWVAGKAVDADLHCWREGFDDWLPVDKVSHFRGIRAKPASASAPPPLPRAATGAARVVRARGDVEDTPKPLFAATMASLEKSVAPDPARGGMLPSITGSPRPSASPPGGYPSLPAHGAKANGSPALGARHAMPSATPASGPATGQGAAGRVPLFDPADSATQIESPPFADEQLTAAEPIASARRKAEGNEGFVKAMSAASNIAATAHATPAASPIHADSDDSDDDLDIGEVSRVVNLADLARSAPRAGGDRAQPASRRSGPIPGGIGRTTGNVPRLAGTGPNPMMPGAEGAGGPPLAGGAMAPQLAPIAPAASHRRGMIALVAGAVFLVGVAVAVVLLVTGGDDRTIGGLGRGFEIDTTRPDDPIRRPGAGSTAVAEPRNPFIPKKQPWRPSNPIKPPDPDPGATGLDAREIEAMAAKNSGMTQRCYIRAQRGVDGILIGDVKKIYVTLTVDGAGSVSNVKLSQHANTSLGKCLVSSIKGWKFRQSEKGITAKFAMVFQSG